MRFPRSGLAAAALAAAIILGACGDAARPAPTPAQTGPDAQALAACTRCHGDAANGNAAPPRSVMGATDPGALGVGAHQKHLQDSAFRKAIACGECHVVPATQDAPGHIDSDRATLTFGALATASGAKPSWDRASATCSSVYCHGATLDRPAATPAWTGGASLTCAGCHGFPPQNGKHPAVDTTKGAAACNGCHPGTVTPQGQIDLAGGLHINGTLDFGGGGGGGGGCTACHGDSTRVAAAGADPLVQASPPTTATGADPGAHQAHVNGGASPALHAPYACSTCHVVPTSVPHSNGKIDVVFGTGAGQGGATGVYDAATHSCSSTYCHGNLPGADAKYGLKATATWTNPASGKCGTCHGIPPPASTGHVQSTDCGSCHTGYTSTSVNAALHVNGVKDVGGSGGCTSCHGDSTRVAVAGADGLVQASPPITATGASPGAHQAHVNGGAATPLHGPYACAECHVVPTSIPHSNGVVDVAFGAGATTGGATPAWNATAKSCASTYCHGKLPGADAKYGSAATPTWTNVASGACGTCHGVPPALSTGHPQRTDCGACHTGYTQTTVNLALHVNGVKDVAVSGCTACHGDATRAGVAGADANVQAAPPQTASGASPGAHLAHVNGGASPALANPFGCAECHSGAVPTTPTGHTKGSVTVAFGAVAKAGGVAPTWNATALSCAATYCHGNFPKYGKVATASWTDPTTGKCGSCHDTPPAAATGHPQRTDCGACHTGYTQTTVNVALHVNGVKDVSGAGCTACHGDPNRVTKAGVDVNFAAAPPTVATGPTPGAGAHLAHTYQSNPSPLSKPLACAECHAATDASHPNGTKNVTFGTIATTGGKAPTYSATAFTCASTYCHGNFAGGNGTAATPAWSSTAGPLGCTACHGFPPSAATGDAGHPQRDDCGTCHSGYSKTGATTGTVNVATHVNGAVEVVPLTCTTCHGNASLVAVANADANVKAAPPVDTRANTATTAAGVGVHQTHVNGSRSKPVACAECHSGAVPTTPTHANGTLTVAFGTLAKTGSVTPAWNATALTCASTYCHGNFTGGNGTAATPAWTSAGTLACNACHGAPPALPHPQNTSCGTCHPGYTSTTVNAVTHVNGVVDQTGTGCTQCHGTPGRAVPTGGDANIAASPPIDSHGNTVATARGVGAHQTHLGGGALRNPIACSECHAVPATGDKTHANGTPAITFGALARTGGVTPSWNGAATGGATTCSNVYCHGNFKNGTATNAPNWTGTGQAACGTCHAIPPAGTHPTVAAGTNCGSCHPGYDATPGATSGTVNLATHVNGQVDGGGESTGGSSCGGCHNTIFSMMNGSVAKTTKHTLASDVPNDTGGTWTGNLKTAAPYAAASCVSMCHGDHPHAVTAGGTHEYNAYADANARSTTSSTTTRSKTDFDAAQTNGGLCISCHQNPVDANHPAISKAGFTAAAHNFTTNAVGTTTYTWQYTLHDGGAFQRNCTKCHASQAEGDSPTVAVSGSSTVGPHASDFGSLLAGPTNPGTTPATFVCYSCHGDGTTGKNMSGKVIYTEAAKAQGHGGKINSDAKHVTSAEDATTYNSGLYSGANRHVNCLDCHDTHMAGKTKHTVGPNDGAITASSPLNGVSGVGYTGTLPANFSAIPSTNLARVAQATAEYQLCFKCHTGWAYGTTPPTGTSGQVETDLAQEFNVNNKAAHPVVNTLAAQTGSTAKGLVASQLLAPWNTSAGNQTMTCTDCHNTDAASTAAQGPHGSAVAFMLAGTNKAWPYTSATSNGGTTGTLFHIATSETGLGTTNGLFCRNCHPQMNSTGSNSLHRNSNMTGGQHGNGTPSACVSCHLRVPHGGKVSRLLVTTNAPARYKVGTSNFAQITKGATKDSYSTSSFPSGFKSSCSEHSSGTGNEAW